MVNDIWKYIKRYLPYGFFAAIFMTGEVMMDLIQTRIMSRIVDEGVLGVYTGGVGNMHLIVTLGVKMISLVQLGGLCGALNNMFVHMIGQNIGNEMRKDVFKKIMTFSFSQVDKFGTGSLVTRVTNDIIQVQNFVSQFVRGHDSNGHADVRQHVFHVQTECPIWMDRVVCFSLYCRLYVFLSSPGQSPVQAIAGAIGQYQCRYAGRCFRHTDHQGLRSGKL